MKRLVPPLGFTLVEVTIALGIFTFSVVLMVGLLPLSLKSAQQATEATRVSKLMQQVGAELSQERFGTAVTTVGQQKEWAFDYDGNATAEPSSTYYKITAQGAASLKLPGGATASSAILRVKLSASTRTGAALPPATITIPDTGY